MAEQRAMPIWTDVTEMGIGTWAWGDRLFWNHGQSHTDADVQAAFEASLAGGVSFFDTAEFYGFGRSERLLGSFIRTADQPVYVSTKFVPYPWRPGKISLLAALRNSLARLGLEQVELYMMHVPLPPVPIETWMGALADAVESGLARTVGVSNYGLTQMRRAHAALARRGVPLASNQVQYHLLHREPERNGLVGACRELRVALVAYSPLAQGLLTGKYSPENPPFGVRRLRFGRRRLAKVQPLVEILGQIGQVHGKTPAQVALNWLICKGAVPIPGAKTALQAKLNMGATGWRLTAEGIAALDSASDSAA